MTESEVRSDGTDNLRAARQINALAFNAVGRALSEADVFVRLDDRQKIASAVLEAVQDEIERQVIEEFGARFADACLGSIVWPPTPKPSLRQRIRDGLIVAYWIAVVSIVTVIGIALEITR